MEMVPISYFHQEIIRIQMVAISTIGTIFISIRITYAVFGLIEQTIHVNNFPQYTFFLHYTVIKFVLLSNNSHSDLKKNKNVTTRAYDCRLLKKGKETKQSFF